MDKKSYKLAVRVSKLFVSLLTAVLVSTVLSLPIVGAQTATTPGLLILSPAGVLTPSSAVGSSFVVSFTVSSFNLVEPEQIG